jgi:hypothetical protein
MIVCSFGQTLFTKIYRFFALKQDGAMLKSAGFQRLPDISVIKKGTLVRARIIPERGQSVPVRVWRTIVQARNVPVRDGTSLFQKKSDLEKRCGKQGKARRIVDGRRRGFADKCGFLSRKRRPAGMFLP